VTVVGQLSGGHHDEFVCGGSAGVVGAGDDHGKVDRSQHLLTGLVCRPTEHRNRSKNDRCGAAAAHAGVSDLLLGVVGNTWS